MPVRQGKAIRRLFLLEAIELYHFDAPLRLYSTMLMKDPNLIQVCCKATCSYYVLESTLIKKKETFTLAMQHYC